jgi:uncharacterized protein (DUF1800 family)
MSSSALRLSRRQALGLAAAGAASAAGLRMVTLNLGGANAPVAAASAAGPNGAWPNPLGDARVQSAHLLRRAGFGYTRAELDAAASLSYSDLVDMLVQQTPDPLPVPPKPTDYRSVVQTWYTHMATTKAQFPERMTLFLHAHFTSDYRKANRRPYVHQQNQTYRTVGLTDLRSLLRAVTYDPLMMEYLDLTRSSATAPNENYSRELMELYTMGVGNYSEQDVREGARALSGIRVQAVDSSGNKAQLPRPTGKSVAALNQYSTQLGQLAQQGVVFKGVLSARQHDQGIKTYLGQTGNLGPEEVIDAILAKDATATFIATKALTYFSVPQPSNDYVGRIATAFRNSTYDMKTLMRTIFLSDEFKSGAAYRALVRSPADYMVATMRALGQADLAASAVTAGQAMDQILYDPPTVAGWPVNGGWVSSSSWLARLNFAQTVINRGGTLPDPVAAVKTQLDGVVSDDTARVFNASQTVSDRWYALLASPEFALK